MWRLTEGEKIMKDWFKKVLKENLDDLTKKGKNALGKAIEPGLDEAKKEVSPDAVERLVRNLYSNLNNPQIANKISDALKSIDGDKINDTLQQFVEPFKTEEGSIQLAKILKQLQQTGQLDDMMDKLTDNVDNMAMPQKFAVKFLMSGIEPVLKNVDSLSEEELASEIRENFADMPTNDISDMIESFSRSVTPEAINAIRHQATGKLPAPKTIANIFSDIVEAGRKRASNDNKNNSSLKDEIADIIKKNMAEDEKTKSSFGGGINTNRNRRPGGGKR